MDILIIKLEIITVSSFSDFSNEILHVLLGLAEGFRGSPIHGSNLFWDKPLYFNIESCVERDCLKQGI